MDAFSAGHSLAISLARLAAAAGVGAGAGAAYFTALWWNVALFDQGATPRALGLLLVRFGLLAAVFLALAKGGAGPLLAGAAGLFVARRFVLRRFGKF